MLGGRNIVYELAGKTKAIAHGRIGVSQRVVRKLGLAREIDARIDLLETTSPAPNLITS